MKTNKATLHRFLRTKLETDPKWAKAALLRIYDNQTSGEKMSAHTHCWNNIGFTVGDARILTKMAEFYKARGFLTAKQMKWIFSLIGKYAGQLTRMPYFSYEKLAVIYRKSAVRSQAM